MILWKANLLATCYTPAQFPPARLREIALVGRSNVGKSTLVNKLLGQRLAHVSNTPGKTRSINFFSVTCEPEKVAFLLVDLPGYGFAKRGKSEQREWKMLVEEYLLQRDSLDLVLQLVDFRHGLLDNDWIFQQWAHRNNIPVQIVFTKADKIARGKHRGYLERYLSRNVFSKTVPHITSATSGLGVEELKLFLTAFYSGQTAEA
jgi:GTP-binding protein